MSGFESGECSSAAEVACVWVAATGPPGSGNHKTNARLRYGESAPLATRRAGCPPGLPAPTAAPTFFARVRAATTPPPDFPPGARRGASPITGYAAHEGPLLRIGRRRSRAPGARRWARPGHRPIEGGLP